METVARATDEEAILQIELQDLEYAKRLLGDTPDIFVVNGGDVTEILELCRAELTKQRSTATAVVVITGCPEKLRLEHCTAVFQFFRQTFDESVYLLLGVILDMSWQSGMRVTWLTDASNA